MSGEFLQGAQVATEQNKQNPFSIIMNRFDEGFARKMKERQAEDADLKDLKKTFLGLQYKYIYDTELQKAKAEEDRKTELAKQESTGMQTQKLIDSFGGNVPPGTTAKLGNLTVPLNPKLTQEQGSSVAAAQEVKDDSESFKKLLTKHEGEPGVIAKLMLPYAAVGGETEEMKRITDQLRARIPFAKGGKQLTPFEAKILFNLLPQPGQSKVTIEKNLDKFVSEFSRMSEIAIKGTAGVGSQAQGNDTEYQKYLQAIGQ